MTIEVLLVDDDELVRIGVRTILEPELDIDVVAEASTGREAFELATRLEPDVVLMDLRLPDFDGLEATRRIASHHRDGYVPPKVIVLTTFDVAEYADGALRAGASAFLLKRVPAEQLIDAVRAVHAGDPLTPPDGTRHLVTRSARMGPSPVSRREMLTGREADVLVLMARGLSNQEIADRLGVSVETVRSHLKHIYDKWDVRDRLQAVIAAYDSGLVGAPPLDSAPLVPRG
jgi:DNA-binding NarL/FixJ family response regulator